ncbi:MAG: aspartate aminotransferase family protein [Bdellovibrionales bacterium]|nr:aspartate aminotransferase family protein [Bdellovibrionales bacterium]
MHEAIIHILNEWISWRKETFKEDGLILPDKEINHSEFKKKKKRIFSELNKITKDFSTEIPRHSPHYIGHMFSEFTLPALFGHIIGLLYNPNNISSESSKVGVKIERKTVAQLSKMIGYPKTAVGHFTSGGTIANFEMLHRFKKNSGTSQFAIFIPNSCHYSWHKGTQLVGISKEYIHYVDLDQNGRMDTKHLERLLKDRLKQRITNFAIVSVLGTTELGIPDPIDKIEKIISSYRSPKISIWHHIDAAYGGFLCSLKDSKKLSIAMRTLLKAVGKSDSITIDPHKLGYTPYSSGCFISKSSIHYKIARVDAPYLDYVDNNQPGLYTLEGSRSVGGALATYMNAKTIGFDENGLGKIILRSIKNADQLRKQLSKVRGLKVISSCNTNIVCFFITDSSLSLKKSNRLTKKLYQKINSISELNKNKFYVSKTILDSQNTKLIDKNCSALNIKVDDSQLFLIRCTIMNPFFESVHFKKNIGSLFVDLIQKILDN